MNTIDIVVQQYNNTEKLEQLHRERQETQSMKEFQQWLSEMKIGSRIERREGIDRANEIMRQWDNEWQGRKHWPNWIQQIYG